MTSVVGVKTKNIFNDYKMKRIISLCIVPLCSFTLLDGCSRFCDAFQSLYNDPGQCNHKLYSSSTENDVIEKISVLSELVKPLKETKCTTTNQS